MNSGRLNNLSNKQIGIALALLLVITSYFFIFFLECVPALLSYSSYLLTSIIFSLLLPKATKATTFKNPYISAGGGVALFLILLLSNPLSEKACHAKKSRNITVFVHGKKGKQDLILRQKGLVIMDLGGERKISSINENGQSFFQNLRIGDKVRLEIDFSEPYKSTTPDSVYLIGDNDAIYLEIELEGINLVKGTVLDEEERFLQDVIVKLATKTGVRLDTTNSTGDFNFDITENAQQQKYDLFFFKEGYKPRSEISTPQTNQSIKLTLEKIK